MQLTDTDGTWEGHAHGERSRREHGNDSQLTRIEHGNHAHSYLTVTADLVAQPL